MQDPKLERNAFCRKFVKLDTFGQPVEWLLPNSESVFNSVPGAFCSLILYMMIMLYGGYRLLVLQDRSDYNVLTEVQDFYFSEEFKFTPKDGLQVAARITSYGNTTDIEDPEIGAMEFYIKGWKADLSPICFKKLKKRKCNLDDFQDSATNQEVMFFPLHIKSESLKEYVPTMQCIDEQFDIYGDFDTNIAQNLMVTFTKCDPAVRTCKSNEEITKWLDFKYILLLENEQKYI